MRKVKNSMGITLIALVITIMVLLILAGISIATLTGNSGVLTQATNARIENRAGKVQEIVDLWKSDNYSTQYIEWETETEKELLDKLLADGSVKEEEIDRNNKIIKIGNREINYKIDIVEKVNDPNPGELAGDGNEENPLMVQSIEDLVSLSNSVNNGNSYSGLYIKLEKTLDFASNNSYALKESLQPGGLKEKMTSGVGFRPIGVSTGYIDCFRFLGTFDGNDAELRNLYMNVIIDFDNYEFLGIGLFGNNHGTIENLKITGNIKGELSNSASVGGICGDNQGNIVNCYNYVKITSSVEDIRRMSSWRNLWNKLVKY